MLKITYDIAGELSLLGSCILNSNHASQACQTLLPEMFFEPIHKTIFRHIKELYDEGSEVNLDSIIGRSKIRGTFDQIRHELGLLRSSAIHSSFKSSLKNIVETYKKGEIVALFKKAVDNLDEKPLEEIEKLIIDYRNNGVHVKDYTFMDIDKDFYGTSFEEWLAKREEDTINGKTITGIQTGFGKLDEHINGLNIGHYTIIAGTPGSGKTTFAIQMMKHLLENDVKCGFLSLEMIKEQAFIKFLSVETGMSYSEIDKANYVKYDKSKRYDVLAAKEKFISNKNFILQDASVENLSSLRSRIRKLVEVHGIEVIFIDYITLIENINNGLSTVEKLVETSSLIRRLLNEFRISGVIISQLNRSHSDQGKAPDKHHLYGSGQLEKDAHEILMLHHEEFSDGVKLYIRKNRFGMNNVTINYNFENGIFDEVE